MSRVRAGHADGEAERTNEACAPGCGARCPPPGRRSRTGGGRGARPAPGGRAESAGWARAARAAGTAPAAIASAIARGWPGRAGQGGVQVQRRRERRGQFAPRRPATRPIRATSPSTAANSRGRVQPRAASTPSSVRRPRTAAVAELATNSAQTTRIRANKITLLRSTASRIVTATPSLIQSSVSSSGGPPDGDGQQRDRGRRRGGSGHDIHGQAVRSAICPAAALIRLRRTDPGR